MLMDHEMTATALEAVDGSGRGVGRRPAPIDLVHLARQTFGSSDLEREILGLFALQTKGLVAKIATAEPKERAALVHRLKGSARGVGASRVARLAEALEAPALVEADARRLIVELTEAGEDVCGFVDAIL